LKRIWGYESSQREERMMHFDSNEKRVLYFLSEKKSTGAIAQEMHMEEDDIIFMIGDLKKKTRLCSMKGLIGLGKALKEQEGKKA
jgi:hypothetical protein